MQAGYLDGPAADPFRAALNRLLFSFRQIRTARG
jgi:hypothetical protein